MHDAYIVVDPPSRELTSGRIDIQDPPMVSFCIPTLNNEKTLDSCLKSVVSQDYPKIEIVVVDGGSSDRTVEIAGTYTDKIFMDAGTLGSATQTAVDNCAGDVIAIFDDDIVIPYSSWLRNVIQYFNYSDKVSTVWPMVVAPPNATRTTKLYNNIYKNNVRDRVLKQRGNCGGGNSLYWKPYMEEIGGIDRSIHWGLDFDWAKKLKGRGYQVVLTYDALYHDTMTSLREFVKKQFVTAEAFTKNNFDSTGLSTTDLLYEQFVLGAKGMASGLVREREYSWALYPLFVLIRVIVFGSAHLGSRNG